MFINSEQRIKVNAEFLKQLELIRDNLASYADEIAGLWAVVHAIDEVLKRHGRR